MYRARKEFKFSAAHMLDSSYTVECQQIHGHNYTVEVVIECTELNRDGMVIDFGKLKNIAGSIIDGWDHKVIFRKSLGAGDISLGVNPTAENMAKILYTKISEELAVEIEHNVREQSATGYVRTSLRVAKIRVTETDSSWAEYIG